MKGTPYRKEDDPRTKPHRAKCTEYQITQSVHPQQFQEFGQIQQDIGWIVEQNDNGTDPEQTETIRHHEECQRGDVVDEHRGKVRARCAVRVHPEGVANLSNLG